jgi:hypothetical protein
VGVHSSAIACGMILDEGMVLGWMLFTLCSVTSLSLGMVLLLKRGKADFEVDEKDIWEFFAYSSIQTSPQSTASPFSPVELPGNLWSSRDIDCRWLLIGYSSSSPLHPLGKGRACYRLALVFVTEVSIVGR